jgi:hypothetical protein
MKHVKVFESFVEEKRGLWDNVHAKRKRGEAPAKPGDEDYPDDEAWDSATGKKKNESVEENNKDSDTYLGNAGEDKRMVDIRTFRGTVKDLTDFIEDKIKNQ